MSTLFQGYDRRIRSHILIDAVEKVPIEESYENLCKEIGKKAITFYDFQFWYYRFLKTKPEFDFDRSSEPKPLQFSDLPLDAVGWIVDQLGLGDRVVLRKVCRPLRDFIGKQNNVCDDIDIRCSTDDIWMSCDDQIVIYAKNDSLENYYTCGITVIVGDNYESEAFNDLAWILKNQKDPLTIFKFSYYICDKKKSKEENEMIGRCCKRMENVLKSLKHQVPVEKVHIKADSPDSLLAILPFLKPEKLECIEIHSIGDGESWKNSRQKILQIVSLDQWKQANVLEINFLFNFFPDNAFTNFKSFWIQEKNSRSGAFLLRLQNIFAESSTLEHGNFYVEQEFNSEDLRMIGAPNPPDHHAGHVLLQYMIPDSNQYLDFCFYASDAVDIMKMTRE